MVNYNSDSFMEIYNVDVVIDSYIKFFCYDIDVVTGT